MTKYISSFVTVLGVLLFSAACDRPVCENANPVFDNFAPDSREYKAELIKQLAKVDRSKLSYWMDTYHESDRSRSILAHIQGEGLCAKIELDVNESQTGIEDLLQKKGIGYQGAELEDLEFDIKQDTAFTTFVFQKIDGIVD